MRHLHREGELFLNGHAVGHVIAEGDAGSWKFGHFTPAEGFSQFASIFGAWSLLAHDDEDRGRRSADALQELRDAETAIDSLNAEIVWNQSQEHTVLVELTIDDNLIEWRQN